MLLTELVLYFYSLACTVVGEDGKNVGNVTVVERTNVTIVMVKDGVTIRHRKGINTGRTVAGVTPLDGKGKQRVGFGEMKSI